MNENIFFSMHYLKQLKLQHVHASLATGLVQFLLARRNCEILVFLNGNHKCIICMLYYHETED